mmetsp:Transcript_6880/g.8915  ORF Transcript_6880/g.8915 Transcript_6880/m.8915 type:complete len:211 (-) Transcript_6880:243-875(-)
MIKVFKTRIIGLRQSRIMAQIVFHIHGEFGTRDFIITINIRLFEFIIIPLEGIELVFCFCLFQSLLVLLNHVLQLLVLLRKFVNIVVVLAVKLLLFFLELCLGLAQNATAVELGPSDPAECTREEKLGISRSASSATASFLLSRCIIVVQIILSTSAISAIRIPILLLVVTPIVVVISIRVLRLTFNQRSQGAKQGNDQAPPALCRRCSC